MQQTPGNPGNGQREPQRTDEWQDQQQRTNARIRGQIEQAQKSLDRQAELVEQARQQRQQQAAQHRSTQTEGQGGRRLVIRNGDDENTPPQQQQSQSEPREPSAHEYAPRDSRAELQGQPDPRAMPLEDAASYALRRDEEHLDRQDALGSMIDESSDPVERERLTLVKDAEHDAYSADQIDRILDMQTRLDRVAGTNVSSSPEFERLRERGTEHRAALGDTMQALERHHAQHPPKDRPQASTRAEATPNRSAEAASPATQATPSPRPNFAERAAARRTAAEAQGATMPPREHTTSPASPGASHAPAPARTTDETRGRGR